MNMPDVAPIRDKADERKPAPRPDFDQIVLVLQGGGALGAYQAGVYEALAEAGLHPDWVVGTSIGAINSAIIVGNAPNDRVAKLRAFWERVTVHPWWNGPERDHNIGDLGRQALLQMSASFVLTSGACGFFAPRQWNPWLALSGTPGATSFYDTAPLRATLEQLVDFDRINAREIRLSIGAVNVRTGELVYFENGMDRIGPAHVMASGSLPPGFPATEIAGEYYWDGGVVSNTPLQYVADSEPRRDTLAFEVDLWDESGDIPHTMSEVLTRQKDIQYSSRARASIDRFRQIQKLRSALATLLAELPPELRAKQEVELLSQVADRRVYSLVQLIYRSNRYEGQSKDFEFSRLSMDEHWRSGYHDTVRALRQPEALRRPSNIEGLRIVTMSG